MRKSDIIIAVVVLTIAALLLIPLPTLVLDILITVNIAFSLLLLLIGLYLPSALGLLAFPSLLLLTTLFRLGLNVASCRLILSQGDAGKVIESFGNFLIRGELVVGIVIFSIITVVNFIVIAKGASRVSEVAARFALEAIPGKQMAIDSDLRAGLLSAEQARSKREDLRKESQLYGSMDGAMKFVQGDAIAGVFIIFANILGGLYMGLSQGMPIGEAIHTYTTLTVGDGLVTQVPALLIAICAGVVVTRVASNDQATLGSDVGIQLFSRPRVVFATGCILCILGIIPGLPTLAFITVGLAVIFGSYLLMRQGFELEHAPSTGWFGGRLLLPSPTRLGLPVVTEQDAEQSDEADAQVKLFLDETLLYRLYRSQMPQARKFWAQYSENFQSQIGLIFPKLSVASDPSLSAGTFSFSVNDTFVERNSVETDALLVTVSPSAAAVLGLPVLAEVEHPITGQKVFWTQDSQEIRLILSAGEISYHDFFGFITLRVCKFLLRNPEEIFTLSDLYTRVKGIEKRYPGFFSEAIPKDTIDLSKLTELIQTMVRERLPVGDFKNVLEVVASYCANNKELLSAGGDVDIFHLSSFTRQARKRIVQAQVMNQKRAVRLWMMSQGVQELFEEMPLEATLGPQFLSEENLKGLIAGYDETLGHSMRWGLSKTSVLCPAELRTRVELILRSLGYTGGVIATDELDTTVEIEELGEWRYIAR